MEKIMMDEKESKYDDYKVQCAADDLIRAEAIKADPKMMKLVAKKLEEKKKQINSIDGLRAKAAELSKKDDEEYKEEESEES